MLPVVWCDSVYKNYFLTRFVYPSRAFSNHLFVNLLLPLIVLMYPHFFVRYMVLIFSKQRLLTFGNLPA